MPYNFRCLSYQYRHYTRRRIVKSGRLFCDDLQATNRSVWPSQDTSPPLQSTVQRQAESLIQYIKVPGSHTATGQDESSVMYFCDT